MYIAPGVSNTDWLALRLDEPNSSDWQRAIEIVDARLRTRFLEPADLLIEVDAKRPPAERRFGFAILAIDCLFIEGFQSFIDGLETTNGQSKKLFKKFLTSRPLLSEFFSTPEIAERFYVEFRCGILHQAEIHGSSRVWSVGPILRERAGSLIVNRTELHKRLKMEFENYLNDLKSPSSTFLRSNLRQKMAFVCRDTGEST
jgi:hypothetical protein